MPRPPSTATTAGLVAAAMLFGSSVRGDEPARRIVSLNPSLTAIVLALGAGQALVGVDTFSARQRPEVADLPRVGGLFNPSLEAVVTLRPDLVVLVPSVEQRHFRERLEALSIPVEGFENLRFAQVLENIERLGRLVGRERAAASRIQAIRETRRALVARAANRPTRPRVLLAIQREPLFVVGRGSFIDEMLEAVGAINAAADFADPYPRVSAEWVVAAAPDVLLDASPEPGDPAAFWSRWPSLPAVVSGRVRKLPPSVTLPGPELDRALEMLARAVHDPALGSDSTELGSDSNAFGAGLVDAGSRHTR